VDVSVGPAVVFVEVGSELVASELVTSELVVLELVVLELVVLELVVFELVVTALVACALDVPALGSVELGSGSVEFEPVGLKQAETARNRVDKPRNIGRIVECLRASIYDEAHFLPGFSAC
jgi:hypothetical protein